MNISGSKDFYCDCDFVFNGKVEVQKEEETERVLAFRHTKPSYEFHVVIVPKEHIPNLLNVENFSLIQEVFQIAQKLIKKYELDKTNFRIITNGGEYQDSKHLHFHLISGNALKIS
ncbi:MAG: hypothetical protein A3D24_03945 [Candidatus Blackburnbacteria bacterium RIFCSPHIGHO2_02_FULL_39_13]|nr:MAG: hypothetical protein A3D24_03945 [Candidatus Blackburnbacteria bacterium RIFCSPHIGHO2_02_FULL_39_13]OGY15500.1 MAG: hypothetical protein A3I52_00745 [Candidatus Blackburnbacteria bacterium RIFCSPLOWO2_02_FULL_40_10]